MKRIARFILKLTGWKIDGALPPGIQQCIVIEAPHTSNWDFVWGRLCFYAIGLPVRFLIKKEAFFFPFGPLLKAMGGIPVDREKKSNKVLEVAALFRKYPDLILAITPEGTRKRNPHWKKGFYYIAQHARVPIILAYLDYRQKIGGLGPVMIPSGDYRHDMGLIQDFYRDKTARYPERFSPHEFRDKEK
ncbi:MAG TPA: 1-acyl-sn-glycerol-3-phosphate acyltransferase [Bacteroidales bacterium]|nr:1-acyl-sn-glycerol-3-phosphate acyltransferase [Bacteroidales bacterium]